jgi:hypothetical protein
LQEYAGHWLNYFYWHILWNTVLKINFMNKSILIATAITAGTAALAYLITRNRKAAKSLTSAPVPQKRHRTDVFANAKKNLVTPE